MRDPELEHNPTEVTSPIDKKTAFILLGALSELILRIHDHPDNIKNLIQLRIFLSHLTLPLGVQLEEYLTEQGLSDQLPQIQQNTNRISTYLSGIVTSFRNNPDINWVDEEDPVLREALLTPDTQIDTEIVSIMSYRFGKHNVRWALPKPEVYWHCQEIEKLIYVTLVSLEEIFHITQHHGYIVKLHTIGGEFDLSYNRESVISEVVSRLCETDVTNILTQAMPQMVEENWPWYASRIAEKKDQKHHPLRLDYAIMLGAATAQITDQFKEFMANLITTLPEYLRINPEARTTLFSNHFVLGYIKGYIENIFVHAFAKITTEQIETEQWEFLLSHEFSDNGILKMFLLFCTELREQHGEKWKTLLDKGQLDLEHETQFGSQIFEILLNFLKENPKWLKVLMENNSFFTFRQKIPKTPDQLLALLVASKKHSIWKNRNAS